MKKALLAATMLVGLAAPASAIVVGGINFTSSADSLIASTGSYTTSGGSLATVLTDSDPGTYAFSFSSGASVTLGFSQGILNGAGNDFALFDLGVNATFSVTINGNTISGLTSGTGFNAGGFGLNVAQFDLSAFGIANGASITSMLIGMDSTALGNPVPSLSFAGTINTGLSGAVPEPATWAMMLMGFAGLGVAARRRQRAIA